MPVRVTPLCAERLILRKMQASDWRFAHELRGPDISDDEIAERTQAGSRKFVNGIVESQPNSPRALYRFVLVLKACDRPIGWCDAYVNDALPEGVEIGYRVDARYAGRGHATEAARVVMAFAFRNLGARIVWAECEPDNWASVRVLKKLGLRPADDVHGLTEISGGLHFEIDRETWTSILG